jgi:Xaa-Pro aminopeptidase
MFDYASRRARLAEKLEAEGIAALFLGPSADLEYLTGVERPAPSFGQPLYQHGWVTGAFFRPDADPVFVLPRMFVAFHLRDEAPGGELVVVSESDDGFALFEQAARDAAGSGSLAIGDRIPGEAALNLARLLGVDRLRTGSRLVNELRQIKTPEELAAMGRAIDAVEKTMAAVTPLLAPGVSMAELAEAVEHELRLAGSSCPSFATHIFTGLGEDDFDSETATAHRPIPTGTSVMFDFGGVVDGYSSDFGRTVYAGDPPPEYLEAYDVMLAAQEAGRAAAAAGTPAREVNAACRRPIEEAGLGEHFRHRMGHCIGMEVHERPFISSEDETPLAAGMTFTDEPSIIVPGRYSVRIEDILVCEEGGGRSLNSYPAAPVSNG